MQTQEPEPNLPTSKWYAPIPVMTGNQFKTWRASCGLSQAKMGRALGVHVLTVARWEGYKDAGLPEIVVKRIMKAYKAEESKP